MQIGLSIARSFVAFDLLVKTRLTNARQNTAAVSSDEEEDLVQLQMVEQKLLAHDPTFTSQHTHASLASQRSALISAFRPVYEEGDVEGGSFSSSSYSVSDC